MKNKGSQLVDTLRNESLKLKPSEGQGSIADYRKNSARGHLNSAKHDVIQLLIYIKKAEKTLEEADNIVSRKTVEDLKSFHNRIATFNKRFSQKLADIAYIPNYQQKSKD